MQHGAYLHGETDVVAQQRGLAQIIQQEDGDMYGLQSSIAASQHCGIIASQQYSIMAHRQQATGHKGTQRPRALGRSHLIDRDCSMVRNEA